MAPQTEAVFQSAAALPEEERVLLVERLLETLSPDRDEVSEEDLFTELERRRAEVERGEVKPIPWSEVRIED